MQRVPLASDSENAALPLTSNPFSHPRACVFLTRLEQFDGNSDERRPVAQTCYHPTSNHLNPSKSDGFLPRIRNPGVTPLFLGFEPLPTKIDHIPYLKRI
jgi:hypothetical protein